MADNVGVDPSASYTVAADVIGTIAYQRVKVNIGSDGTVSDVDVTNPLPVTGTVSVSVSVAVSTEVSGTVSVSGAVQISGAVSVSAMPAVSGTVSISGAVQISGAVSISAMPGVSIVGVVPVTTAASVSVTGLPVWLNPTQAVVVNTIGAGFSVNALVTGPVSISVMPAVSISVSAVLGTVVTVLGTMLVSVTPGSTTGSSGMSGLLVWLGASQTVLISTQVSGTVAISIPVSQALGTVITILGTQVVTVVPGLSVSAMVSVSAMAASLVMGTIIAVSAVSNLSTVVTVLGTVMVQPNFSTTATPSAAGTGQIIWVANTGALMSTTAVSGATGPQVWLGASQSVVIGAGLPLLIMVTSTAGAQSMTTYLFTMWTGGLVAAAGTTQFAVPSGKRFRINNIQAVINSSAVTGGTVLVAVIGATASASLTSGSVPTQIWYQALQALVSAGPIMPSICGLYGADIVAGTTFAICAQGSTAYQIGGIVIQGNIF